MGFSGGGGGELPAHQHDPTIPIDGGALAINATSFGLANQSLLVSDGANIQEVTVGANESVLKISGGAVGWGADTGASFIQVTKSYTDISGGEIAIYTLPASNSISNIFTNITQAFTNSTAVTLGDTSDPDGYLQAANWTTGTGLTGATRGNYVTTFRGMRSTTGTTALIAYDLAEGGISTATYSGNALDTSAHVQTGGLRVVDSGSKVYYADGPSDDIVRYNLGVAYDISSAVYNQSLSVAGENLNPTSLMFKPDGSILYMLGSCGGTPAPDQDTVFEYALGTNFDLSTASLSTQFSVQAQAGEPRGCIFNSDGTKFYIVNIDSNVYQYSCGTAYDMTTASYDTVTHDFSGNDTSMRDIDWMDSGSTLVLVGQTTATVYSYTCSTPYDLSTVSALVSSFAVGGQETHPTGLSIPVSGKMYVSGEGGGGDTYEYDMDSPDTAGTVDFYLQVVS